MRDRIYIIGGGTVFHVRPHLALSAPAYGKTAWDLLGELEVEGYEGEIHLITTKMAGDHYAAYQLRPGNGLKDIDTGLEEEEGLGIETNEDVHKFIKEKVLPDERARILFLPAALCDFEASVLGFDDNRDSVPTKSGKDQDRLRSSNQYEMVLTPAAKVISQIRKLRKDLFLVGFKTTTGATPEEQFEAGLRLLKQSSCNLVLANDLHTRRHMIITPEQAPYCVTEDREDALNQLVQMALLRSKGHFTRSMIVPGDPVFWNSKLIPDSLRTVVEHCIKRGAYKPFLGATVGHFAVKLDNGRFLTSRRKTNFNDMAKAGMVMVELDGEDRVIAHGSKPSVGGQSQRIVFANHPDVDCIVHFHCPLREGFEKFRTRSQFEHECGSHECGKNTSDGLELWYTDKDGNHIKAVMLDKHGPNIVFSRNVNPQKVIEFIERYWDLERSTSEVYAPSVGTVTGRLSVA